MTGHSAEQLAIGDPPLSKGVGLGDLQRYCLTSAVLQVCDVGVEKVLQASSTSSGVEMPSFYGQGGRYVNDYFIMSRHIKSVFTVRCHSLIATME